MKKVFLVHGWSVKDSTTYQALHLKLAEYGFDLHNIFPGRYVSLDDRVEIRDISAALQYAITKHIGTSSKKNKFHIISHSAGALVVKHWIVHHYKGKYIANKNLQNVVFLAAPHFGSRLAHHGSSMRAHMKYGGDTGEQILKDLELGSEFNWEITEQWFNKALWQKKGIRIFNLSGDKIIKNKFESKIFPAGFEPGSDMVVRVAAANLNCRRFIIDSSSDTIKPAGEISGIPFGVLQDYVHSGDKYGIMNSIKTTSSLDDLNLKLIVECLQVANSSDYSAMSTRLDSITAETRKKREGFAQLDFRIMDQDNKPVDDYVIKLGVIKNRRNLPLPGVRHAHKNKISPNHFTIFIAMRAINPELEHFIEIYAKSDTSLYKYSSLLIKFPENSITDLICEDHTTQIDVVLTRTPDKKLFIFHSGDDENLHVRWNRKGNITATGLPIQ